MTDQRFETIFLHPLQVERHLENLFEIILWRSGPSDADLRLCRVVVAVIAAQQTRVMVEQTLSQLAWDHGNDHGEQREGQEQMHGFQNLNDPIRPTAI